MLSEVAMPIKSVGAISNRQFVKHLRHAFRAITNRPTMVGLQPHAMIKCFAFRDVEDVDPYEVSASPLLIYHEKDFLRGKSFSSIQQIVTNRTQTCRP